MEKLDYVIPMQSEARINKVNEELGTDFKPTEWHVDELTDKVIDMVIKLMEENGRYLGDHISVKIEMEYKPEDK